MVGRGTIFFRLLLAVVTLASICSVISADGETDIQETPEDPPPPSSPPIPLTIREIRKVGRPDDPSGRQQNIRLVVARHDPISGAETFSLSLQTFDNRTISYQVVQLPDPDATEFEFGGNFVGAKEISVRAEKNGSVLALGSVRVDVEDPGSKVAWVGDPQTPSLRVDPGERSQVEVPGHPPCVRNVSGGPCYYLGHSDRPLDPPPPRCDDLGLIVFCDEVVSQLQGPDYPTNLQLYNREMLRVLLSPLPSRTEVVVSLPDSDTILSPDDYACGESYILTCVQPVDVPASVGHVYITAVGLDEEGYVNVSSATLFEVFEARAVRLAPDVYEVVPAPSNSPGNYSVSLNANAFVSCGGDGVQEDSGCRVYFDRVIYEHNVTLAKRGRLFNMVLYPVVKEDPPPSSKIHSITSLSKSPSKMRVQVKSRNTITKAEFVLFEDNVATSSLEVEVDLADSGYVADVPACEGRCEFVLLGYGVDGDLVETGQAYFSLEDLDKDVVEVGRETALNSSSLRVEATWGNDVTVEGVGKCNGYRSPCYFFGVARETVESATYCINITSLPIYGLNRTWLFHCSDEVIPYSELRGDFSLTLTSFSEMVVSGSFPTNLTEIVVFDPVFHKELSIGSTKCSGTSGTTQECTRFISGQNGWSPLGVLVTALESNGTVLSSVVMTYTYPEESTPTWVIVVSIFGSLALVALVVAFVRGKKKKITVSTSEK